MGGQYKDLNDGEWIYDIAANIWKGKEKGVESPQRVYRTGPFQPSYFMQEPHPDRDAFSKWLDELPVNTWKMTKPPHLPQMNRDWGTAVLDPDHDVILRWSGGHSAHGGTDVLHFHLATNRWELPFPVSFRSASSIPIPNIRMAGTSTEDPGSRATPIRIMPTKPGWE